MVEFEAEEASISEVKTHCLTNGLLEERKVVQILNDKIMTTEDLIPASCSTAFSDWLVWRIADAGLQMLTTDLPVHYCPASAAEETLICFARGWNKV